MSSAPEPPAGAEAGPSPPGLGAAFLLGLAAWLLTVMAAAPLVGWASPPTAMGVGAVLGFGGLGTLLARRLPPPVEERIGLRGFDPRLLLALLLLVPAAILASELDNLVKATIPPAVPEPPPDAAPGEEPAAEPVELSRWLLVEGVVVMVLLRPVVEEFFFRGVLLQGLVAHHGTVGGVAAAALLSALAETGFGVPLGPTLFVSVLLQGLAVGVLLGAVRVVSGSLLAPILLLAALRGFGGVMVLFRETLPIPGFNAPGDHTPALFLTPALLSVGLGVAALARAEPPPPPPPPPPAEAPPGGA